MNRIGQGALEFTIITVTMLIAFSGVFLFMEYQFQQAQISRQTAFLQEVSDYILSEIEIAAIAGDGYERVFFIPETIVGIPYEIYIHLKDPAVDQSRDELIIEYQGDRTIFFIPHQIQGDFTDSGPGYDEPIEKGYFCIRGTSPIELIERGIEPTCP